MTKEKLTKLQSQMLAVLGREFPALEIVSHGGTFSLSDGVVKFRITERDNEQVRREEWERYAPVFGLPTDAFGKVFTDRAERWIITGIKISRAKYPVIARCLTGEKAGQTLYFSKQALATPLSSVAS